MGDLDEGWGAPCDPELRDTVGIRCRSKIIARVRALIFGAWAVHRAVPVDMYMEAPVDPAAWGVTHVPSGYTIANWVADLAFWDAVRVARALEDSGILPDDRLECDVWLLTAVIGAALQDHYVWPLYEIGGIDG